MYKNYPPKPRLLINEGINYTEAIAEPNSFELRPMHINFRMPSEAAGDVAGILRGFYSFSRRKCLCTCTPLENDYSASSLELLLRFMGFDYNGTDVAMSYGEWTSFLDY